MIRKAHDVVHDVAYESLCGPQSDGNPEGVITADRLAVVARLREIAAREHPHSAWAIEPYARKLESEIRAASEPTGGDDGE